MTGRAKSTPAGPAPGGVHQRRLSSLSGGFSNLGSPKHTNILEVNIKQQSILGGSGPGDMQQCNEVVRLGHVAQQHAAFADCSMARLTWQ